MTKTITPQSEVMLHMVIKLKDGSIAENTRKTARPVKVVLGDKSLSDPFEQALIGLAEGETKQFELKTQDAFGESIAENIMVMPRSQFDKDIELEVGMIIEFEDMNGAILLGVVRNIEDDQVTVDFNHPLAGQDLNFEIEVMEILN